MIEAFDKAKHNRKNFDCGNERLNDYLLHRVSQDIRRKLSACFVLAGKDKRVIGYYTLASHSILTSAIPDAASSGLQNSYTIIPVTLLGRFAIDSAHQGKGVGTRLLVDALIRAFENTSIIGSHAIVVDPFDERSAQFYKQFGFLELPDSQKLFIAMGTIAHLAKGKL